MFGEKMIGIAEGVRNLVEFANLDSGDEVLILAREVTSESVIRSLASHTRSQSAEVVVLIIDEIGESELPPRSVEQAMAGCDVLFDLGHPLTHTRSGMISIYDHAVKYMLVPHPPSLAMDAARFPSELWYVIARKVQEQVRSGTQVKVEAENGTDFEMEVRPEDVGAYIGPEPFKTGAAVPGYIGLFPFGSTPWGDIQDSANGTLCLDAFHTFGEVDTPIEWVIEDGWITDFRGSHARDIEDIVAGVPNATRLAEIGIPSNPKIPPSMPAETPEERATAVAMLIRRAGNLQVAMGSDSLMGGSNPSPLRPLFGIVRDPDISIDDELLVDDGRLTVLDEPEVIQEAERYGDPEDLLARKGGRQ